MKKSHASSVHVTKAILYWAIITIIGYIAAFPADSNAHTIRPTKCDIVWHQAPPGHRWEAKQRCLAYVARHNCIVHQRPVPRTVRVKGARVNANQRHVIGWIVNEGQRRKLGSTFILAALVATTQEASAMELRHGHGTSLGPFQLIDKHGPAHLRITVEFSGNWFYNGAVKEWRRLGPMSAPALAQEVEESGYPGAYRQWLPESRRTLAAVLGTCRIAR